MVLCPTKCNSSPGRLVLRNQIGFMDGPAHIGLAGHNQLPQAWYCREHSALKISQKIHRVFRPTNVFLDNPLFRIVDHEAQLFLTCHSPRASAALTKTWFYKEREVPSTPLLAVIGAGNPKRRSRQKARKAILS